MLVRMERDLKELRRLKFMPSRIPLQDALETFVPTDAPPDDELQEITSRTGSARWYPVEGGHRVLILFQGGSYDPQRFTLQRDAWDHEHCSHCGDTIPSMTLCWVTASGEYIVLDEKCYRELQAAQSR